jgi:hypothetical protein
MRTLTAAAAGDRATTDETDRLIASDKIESTALRQAQFDAVLGTIGFDCKGGVTGFGPFVCPSGPTASGRRRT